MIGLSARRLKVEGDAAAVVGDTKGSEPIWRVTDAATGEAIAGVYKVEIVAEISSLPTVGPAGDAREGKEHE